LRVLIDTVNVTSPGGIQNGLELAKAAEQCCPDGWDIEVLRAPEGVEIGDSKRLRVRTYDRSRGWSGFWRWFNITAPSLVREYEVDVFYSLSGFLSRQLHRACGTVNSINNMLPFSPEATPEISLVSKDKLRLWMLRRAFVSGSRLADALTIPSRHGLAKLEQYAGPLADKTFIAPNPIPSYATIDEDAPPPHPRDGTPYFLYLSVMRPYKNHFNLVEAYKRAVASEPTSLPNLVIAGPPEDESYVERVCRFIKHAGLEERVQYLGLLPREDLPAWMHHATVNFFPSTCETSSYVQAEIIGAHGVMACSNCPPMPEIAGGAAELFDPLDPDSIRDVMLRLPGDTERLAELRRLSRKRRLELSARACGDAVWKAVIRASETLRARKPPFGEHVAPVAHE